MPWLLQKKTVFCNGRIYQKKFKTKSFAAGAKREQMALCEEKLGIKLDDLFETALSAMQSISSDLGL